MFQWHFREKRTGDDISDPITGEFFADGSLDNPSTALVREALQNALDAGKGIDREGSPVRVRIAMQRDKHAVPPAVARRWFGTLGPHLRTPNNGLRDRPGPDEPCDYLVVEDFGTSGLTGDTESDSADGERNNFVDFLRSDGRTRKGTGDRGSWGVGKNVFPRSSRINAYLAFTVRVDDQRRLVMGKSILKIRTVHGIQYQPSCYLAESWNPDEVPRPFEDVEVIQRLQRDFDIRRRYEPGLSLVIPWLDADIRYQDILAAVVRQYYFAILSGTLQIELQNNSESLHLAADNLEDIVRAQVPEFAEEVALARWALSVDARDLLTLMSPRPDAPQKWSADLVAEEAREAIKTALASRERVAIRVPLHVRQARAAAEPTFFDIYLEHHDGDRVIRPSFFREQLAISGVKRAVGVPKIRALVVVEDQPLADLLRAAEPPNHTDWDMKTANFRHQYRDGNHVITFVKSSVKELLTHVRAGDDEPDFNIAIDFFGVPEPGAVPQGRKDNKNGKEPPKKFPGVESPPQSYGVSVVSGGFAIRPTGSGRLPERIIVAAAYDVLSGSPWKLYEPADFDFTRRDKNGLAITCEGELEYRVLEPNRIELRPRGPNFEFRVVGFDPNRDVIVRAYHRKEVPVGDTAVELHEAEEAHAQRG